MRKSGPMRNRGAWGFRSRDCRCLAWPRGAVKKAQDSHAPATAQVHTGVHPKPMSIVILIMKTMTFSVPLGKLLLLRPPQLHMSPTTKAPHGVPTIWPSFQSGSRTLSQPITPRVHPCGRPRNKWLDFSTDLTGATFWG